MVGEVEPAAHDVRVDDPDRADFAEARIAGADLDVAVARAAALVAGTVPALLAGAAASAVELRGRAAPHHPSNQQQKPSNTRHSIPPLGDFRLGTLFLKVGRARSDQQGSQRAEK